MRRRKFLALSTVLVAGCSGSGSESTPTETETPTQTPTPTPTASPTASPTPELSLADVSLPDGVTEDAVTTDLVNSHQQSILGEPYTINLERVIDSEFSNIISKTTIEVGTNAIHQEQTASGGASNSFWKDGSEGFANANNGEFYYTVPGNFDRAAVSDIEYIRGHVASGEYVPVDAVREGDRTVIIAEASSATASEYLERRGVPNQGRVKSIDEYSGTITFTPQGVITSISFDWSYTSEFEDRTVSEEYDYTVSGIGDTEVTQPDWLGTARENAFTFTPTLSEDRKYIAVEIEGSGDLPNNWAVSLNSQEAGHGFTNRQVTAGGGDTVYVGLKGEGEAVITVNEPPSDVLTLGGRVHLLLDINGLEVIEQQF